VTLQLDSIICGDCLEVMRDWPDKCVDAIVADPPYGMNNDCDYTRFTMGPNGHGEASSRKYQRIYGDDRPFDPSPWLKYPRVLLWGYNHFATRLPVGTILVWIKRFDAAFGTFLSDAELAWMKGGNGVYCRRDTSLLATTKDRTHPNQKPVSLMCWCLEKCSDPGDIILDPFCGSGTTCVAAKMLGRHYIGIDISPEYCEIARERLRAVETGVSVKEARAGQMALFQENHAQA